MKCNYNFELANGEYVSPCHLEKGHTGRHEGYCLGSKCSWDSEEAFDSEYDQYWREYVKES